MLALCLSLGLGDQLKIDWLALLRRDIDLQRGASIVHRGHPFLTRQTALFVTRVIARGADRYAMTSRQGAQFIWRIAELVLALGIGLTERGRPSLGRKTTSASGSGWPSRLTVPATLTSPNPSPQPQSVTATSANSEQTEVSERCSWNILAYQNETSNSVPTTRGC